MEEGELEGQEGYIEGEVTTIHSADIDGDGRVNLGELLRVIQFFNMGVYYACPEIGEDGYCPGLPG